MSNGGFLQRVRTGKRPAPDRILLIGTEGVGKSTWASYAPAPLFLAAEDGIRNLDVASLPEPEDYSAVLAGVQALAEETHEYRSLVIDSVDWLAPILERHVCAANKWADIEDYNAVLAGVQALAEETHEYRSLVIDSVDWLAPILERHVCAANKWADIEDPGYGRGYTAAANEWRALLVRLDGLRLKHGMEIILIGHAQIKIFSNPAGPDFSRYELALDRKATGILKQWVDSVLFAAHEDVYSNGKRGTRVKGISTGKRIVHTVRTAAWDAKTRYDLPDVLPLDYAAYAEARDHSAIDTAVVAAACAQLIDQLPAEKRAAAKIYMQRIAGDSRALQQALNRLRVATDTGAEEGTE